MVVTEVAEEAEEVDVAALQEVHRSAQDVSWTTWTNPLLQAALEVALEAAHEGHREVEDEEVLEVHPEVAEVLLEVESRV